VNLKLFRLLLRDSLSALLVIATQLITASLSTSMCGGSVMFIWISFHDKCQDQRKIAIVSSLSAKVISFLLLYNHSINLQNYTTFPFLISQILHENGVKTHERIREIFFHLKITLISMNYLLSSINCLSCKNGREYSEWALLYKRFLKIIKCFIGKKQIGLYI
jgi:hypothetical protein